MTAALHVLHPSAMTTLQDGGRLGFQRFGMPVSGALDSVSLTIANILAGNPPSAAALEVLSGGLALRVDAESVTLAVAGTAQPFRVETKPATLEIPPLRSFTARRGDILRFAPPKDGAVFYIAAAGGFDIPAVLGSRSTYRRAALGGYRGRVLQAGDDLPLTRPAAPERAPVALDVTIAAPKVLRVMRGPNADYFNASAWEVLFGSIYNVTPSSDRMGLRLRGPRLQREIEGELPSQGTTAGGLQVPADGQPILLLADRQTTGGYPRIATVIGADIAAAGRLAPGMGVRFEEVSRDEAVRLLKAQRDWLASLPSLLRPVADKELSSEQLLGVNLIGGVTSAKLDEG